MALAPVTSTERRARVRIRRPRRLASTWPASARAAAPPPLPPAPPPLAAPAGQGSRLAAALLAALDAHGGDLASERLWQAWARLELMYWDDWDGDATRGVALRLHTLMRQAETVLKIRLAAAKSAQGGPHTLHALDALLGELVPAPGPPPDAGPDAEDAAAAADRDDLAAGLPAADADVDDDQEAL